MSVRIAVDAMGGDYGPDVVVRGVVEAGCARDDLSFALVGDHDAVVQALRACGGGSMNGRLDVVHAADVITMDDSAVEALKRKPESSIAKLVELAVSGRVDAVLSAGHTGAFAAACQLRLRTLPGVVRPGVAVTIPAPHGAFVLCDAGANIQAKPHHLHQYGVMASLYAERMLGIERPRVALMSVGVESGKGTGLVKETYAALQGDETLRFVGNVEGRELFEDRCDVVLCDGFVGNIVLKLAEGLAEGLVKTITEELESEPQDVRARLGAGLERVWRRHDYASYGGAPLLGVNGVCVICHGRSNAQAMRNAALAAQRFVAMNLNQAIEARLAR